LTNAHLEFSCFNAPHLAKATTVSYDTPQAKLPISHSYMNSFRDNYSLFQNE
jgi:hypothetical protein